MGLKTGMLHSQPFQLHLQKQTSSTETEFSASTCGLEVDLGELLVEDKDKGVTCEN